MQEAKDGGLKYGADFVVMGNVAYKTGDRFLCRDEEVAVWKIIDEVHFLDARHHSCWHTNIFSEYRCRHRPALNDPDYTPDTDKTPYAVLAGHVTAARNAFKVAEIRKWKEDIYEDYYKIYFVEEMSHYLENGDFDEALCKFLNVEGALLFEGMYRYYINNAEASINDGGLAEKFVDDYARYYGYDGDKALARKAYDIYVREYNDGGDRADCAPVCFAEFYDGDWQDDECRAYYTGKITDTASAM
jgi:hypothetical protein